MRLGPLERRRPPPLAVRPLPGLVSARGAARKEGAPLSVSQETPSPPPHPPLLCPDTEFLHLLPALTVHAPTPFTYFLPFLGSTPRSDERARSASRQRSAPLTNDSLSTHHQPTHSTRPSAGQGGPAAREEREVQTAPRALHAAASPPLPPIPPRPHRPYCPLLPPQGLEGRCPPLAPPRLGRSQCTGSSFSTASVRLPMV